MEAKGQVVVPRPKMKGPVVRCFWYAGYMFVYGQDAMIRVSESFDPFPESRLDNLHSEVLRQRWNLLMDGMYVSEFLQAGGFLWELEGWMKANKVWVEGKDVILHSCERDEYLDIKAYYRW